MIDSFLVVFQPIARLSFRTAVIILLIYLIRFLLKNHISAQNCFRLWFLVPVSLLFFPNIPFSGSFYNVIPPSLSVKNILTPNPINKIIPGPINFHWTEPTSDSDQAAVDQTADQKISAQPKSDSKSDPKSDPQSEHANTLNTKIFPSKSNAENDPFFSRCYRLALDFLPLIWLQGGILVFLLFLAQFFQCRFWLLKQREIDSSEIKSLFNDCCRKANIRRPPQLRTSPLAKCPVLLGWFNPILLLPENLTHFNDEDHSEYANAQEKQVCSDKTNISEDFENRSEPAQPDAGAVQAVPFNNERNTESGKLDIDIFNEDHSPANETEDQTNQSDDEYRTILKSIFLHELAHKRRGDTVWSFLMSGLLIIHWFNPFLWIAIRSMNGDREEACDERATEEFCKRDRLQYAGALVETALSIEGNLRRPGLVGLLEPSSRLRSRIERLCYPPVIWPGCHYLCVIFALLALIFFFTDGVQTPSLKKTSVYQYFWGLPLMNLDRSEFVTSSESNTNHLAKTNPLNSPAPSISEIYTKEDFAFLPSQEQKTKTLDLSLKTANGLTRDEWILIENKKDLFGLRIPSGRCIGQNDFLRLAKIKNLRYLDLSENESLDYSDLPALRAMIHLKYLKIGGCPKMNDLWTTRLGKFYSLEGLDLSGSDKITDQSLSRLVNLRQLHCLTLRGCSQLTDKSFGHLSTLESLRYIDLSDCSNIKGTGLTFLPQQLEFLNLSRSGLTQEGAVNLNYFTNLRELKIQDCPNLPDNILNSIYINN